MNQEITITDAAKALGKTKQGLSQLLKRHSIKPLASGKYNAERVFKAASVGAAMDKRRLTSVGAESAGTGDPENLLQQKLEQQVRKLSADAETAEFRLEQLRGEHVPLKQHIEDLRSVMQSATYTIDVWIKTTAASIADADMKHKLESARRKAYASVQAEFDSATERDHSAVADAADA